MSTERTGPDGPLSPAPAHWPAGQSHAELELAPGTRIEVRMAPRDRLAVNLVLHAGGCGVELDERQVRGLVLLLMAGWGRLRRGV